MVGRWGTGLCLVVGINSGNCLPASSDGAGNEPEPGPSKLSTCGLDRVGIRMRMADSSPGYCVSRSWAADAASPIEPNLQGTENIR